MTMTSPTPASHGSGSSSPSTIPSGFPVTRFHDPQGHGWYLGRLGIWGLIAGESQTWQAAWQHYTEHTGISLADLRFATEQDRADFLHDIGL